MPSFPFIPVAIHSIRLLFGRSTPHSLHEELGPVAPRQQRHVGLERLQWPMGGAAGGHLAANCVVGSQGTPSWLGCRTTPTCPTNLCLHAATGTITRYHPRHLHFTAAPRPHLDDPVRVHVRGAELEAPHPAVEVAHQPHLARHPHPRHGHAHRHALGERRALGLQD